MNLICQTDAMRDEERSKMIMKDFESRLQKLKKYVSKKAALTMGLILICGAAGISRANTQLPGDLCSQDGVCDLSVESSEFEEILSSNLVDDSEPEAA